MKRTFFLVFAMSIISLMSLTVGQAVAQEPPDIVIELHENADSDLVFGEIENLNINLLADGGGIVLGPGDSYVMSYEADIQVFTDYALHTNNSLSNNMIVIILPCTRYDKANPKAAITVKHSYPHIDPG